MMTFIDDNCVVFDNEEVNKFSYSDIHERFREMADALLLQHLEEVGVNEKDFIRYYYIIHSILLSIKW